MSLALVRPTVTLSRRSLIEGLMGGTVLLFAGGAVSGCSENPALGRSQFMVVSDAQLADMAAGTWRKILATTPLSRDGAQQARLSRIGEKAVAAAHAQYPAQQLGAMTWEFALFDDPQVNAFVMPGGKVGFYRGLLDLIANDDQIAAVMGHEIGHVVARHSAERFSQQLAAAGAMTLVNIALAESDMEFGPEIAAVLGAGVTYGVILPYSRKHEHEADRLGVDVMAKAEFRPAEALTFWQEMTRRAEARPLEWMSTHPSDEARIAAMSAHIAAIGAL